MICKNTNQDAEANYGSKPRNHPGDKLDIFLSLMITKRVL